MKTSTMRAVGLLLLLSGCGIAPSGGKKKAGSGGSTVDTDSADATVGIGLESEAAFAQTVFPLLQEKTCKSCHVDTISPFFADPDPKEAHRIILEAKKVDLVHPEDSRIYTRLVKDKHNCWSADCLSDGAIMLAAIQKWVDLMKKKDEGPDANAIATASLTLADAVEKSDVADSRTVVLEAESGSVVAPMRSVTSATASGGSYIDTPVGNGLVVAANSATAGRTTYNIQVAEAGVYRLWGRVSSASATQNAFYIRVDNGTAVNWLMPVTNGQLAWTLAADQDTGGNIHQFNLSAGAHTLEVRQREPGTRLDMLALTKDLNFRGDSITNPVKAKVLRFPLNDLVAAPGSYFEIEVAKYDAFSFVFKNPAIRTAQRSIALKGVRILLNDVYDPQTATYTVVDTTVTPPGAVVSSAAMVVPFKRSFDADEITISFDKLSIKE